MGFRAMLADEALPAPDEVGYEPDSVVFYWHEPKVAVFVDFEDDGEAAIASSTGRLPQNGPG